MNINFANFDWNLRSQEDVDLIIENLKDSGLNFSDNFLRLCALRGIKTVDELIEFTDQEPQRFHDPYLLYDMDKAVDRIREAVEKNENILIYGDYDADGITSTLILYEALEMIGANVTYYLPNRLTDGYGPNELRWVELTEERKLNLIITCDNGVTGHAAVERMNAINVDVIVTDHHEIQESLPDAYAVIHPNHPDGNYPFKDLSGAGVALKVTSALVEEIMPEALELAAIGTVADMVSLTDENRTIVLSGLNLMRSTQRLGLRLLLDEEKVKLQNIDTDTIGFIIGPRLNAVGRLGDASPALELLKTFDTDEARELLNYVNNMNRKRQELTASIVEEVEERILNYTVPANIILEASDNWSAGVLGIVASRLVNKFHRPAIIFQYDKVNKEYKGSARSITNIDIFQELNLVKEFTVKFGGHSQAAGLTISEEQWEDFKTNLNENMTKYNELISQKESIAIDMQLTADDISIEFIEELDKLGPFGMDNPKPIFLLDDIKVNQLRFIGSDQSHLKFSFNNSNKENLQAIGFSKAEQAKGLQDGEEISFIGELNINEWNGNVSAQVQLKDLGQSGTRWLDYRASEIHSDLFEIREAVYAFAHKSIATQMETRIDSSNRIIIYKDFSEVDLSDYQHLVLMEPAGKLSEVEDLIDGNDWTQIYLGSFVVESKYLAGIPTREELAKFYKIIKNNNQINLTQDTNELLRTLNISSIKFKVIILMFLEAKFVTIENGRLINFNEEQSGKVDLTKLSSYLNYQEAIETEKFLNYQPIEKIINYFERK